MEIKNRSKINKMSYIVKFLIIVLSITSLLSAQTYTDKPYLQDYADKYELGANSKSVSLFNLRSDRNDLINIVSSVGLLQPHEKKIVKNQLYRPIADMNLIAIENYKDQFIYLTSEEVLSTAWAGKFYTIHEMKNPKYFAIAPEFAILIAADGELKLFEDRKNSWQKELNDFDPVDLLFDNKNNNFLILTSDKLYRFKYIEKDLEIIYTGQNLTSVGISDESIILGTTDGILKLDSKTLTSSEIDKKLPYNNISVIKNINGDIWYGTKKGAFTLGDNGKYTYYSSKRWLVDDEVIDISEGPENSVLILTKSGMSRINFVAMTLEEKAAHYQKIQRLRHIRYGLQANPRFTISGDVSSGVYSDTDNDGLWTSMYLAAELFRYAVTKDENAKLNAYEAFEGMERLTEITGIDGFPSRSYTRDGYEQGLSSNGFDEEWRKEWVKKHGRIWRLTEDERWRWKSSTSSDESCGHLFVYALFAELAPDKEWRDRAIQQIKNQVDHIIRNDWYLVDWNGLPTAWGRWNPEYVNNFPINVGDRRLNSTLIIAFLQTAYHFTKDEFYKEKAYELINEHGYDENANRPASVIGFVQGEDLSNTWNHSDDRMYFLTVPAFVRYSFNEEQKKKHFETARSHWDIERPEKNPLWNFIYALVGGKDYDLDNSIWWLMEYPMDIVGWTIDNSQRNDVVRLEPNFRRQQYAELLPPDESPRGGGGLSESSPSDYLLPYWLGRYVNTISAPAK